MSLHRARWIKPYYVFSGDEETVLKIKKSTSFGYASQLLLYVVQHSDDSIPMLQKYLPTIARCCKEESGRSNYQMENTVNEITTILYLNTYHAAGVSRQRANQKWKYSWIWWWYHREMCNQISTNMPSIGLVIPTETAFDILEYEENKNVLPLTAF